MLCEFLLSVCSESGLRQDESLKHASKLVPDLWRCCFSARVSAHQRVPEAGVHQRSSETQRGRNTLMESELAGQDDCVLLWKSSSALPLESPQRLTPACPIRGGYLLRRD